MKKFSRFVFSLLAAVFLLLPVQGCEADDFALNSYKTLESSAITYNMVMDAAADMRASGTLDEDKWNTLRDAALGAAAAVAPEVRALLGRVASGDQFISAEEDRRRIVGTFGALCCEMEGAAIAQAAEANGVPFVVVRAISDKPGSDGQAMDYATFERASAERCAKIVEHMVAAL